MIVNFFNAMEERPNLSYVEEIAGKDLAFASRFILLFKEEYALEMGMYLRYIKNKQPRQAAEIVAKSKYKFSMLGLERASDVAAHYEMQLQQGDDSLDAEYKKILEQVNSFLTEV